MRTTTIRRVAAVLAVGAMALTGAAPSAEAGPATNIRLTGEARDDGFGWSAVAAGDVNADGHVDFLVGAYGDDDVAQGSGEAYLFYGPLTGNTRAAQADATITGESLVDGLGTTVAGAGDLNADGYDDIVVGARSNDGGGIQAGRAYVFYGPLTGPHAATDADATISGDAFDELGWSLASAGDVDGDGYDDLLVGAFMADLVGQALLFLGPLSGDLTTEDAEATITGVIFSEELGDAVAAADVDDDGTPDLVLGAPRPPVNGSDPGSTYVFFGPVTGDLAATEADVTLTGERDNDEFGTSVAAGDVNGDGADDLVVGAHQLFNQRRGRTYVFYGPLSGPTPARDADVLMVGERSNPDEVDLFGSAVATSDMNGDGLDDVVVGAPTNADGGTRAGKAYVFLAPLPTRLSAANADRSFIGGRFDALGTSVATVADADGDGLGDVLVGAPGSFGENRFGYAVLAFGTS